MMPPSESVAAKELREGRFTTVLLTLTCLVPPAGLLVVQAAATPEWTLQVSGVTVRFRGVSAVSDTVAWAVATTPLPAGPSAGIFSVAFRDALHGFIAGGDYKKEVEVVDNAAATSDGGATWTLVKGLSGFRSTVAYVPGAAVPSLLAVGPSGSDYSVDDGRSWTPIESPGLHTFSFARRGTLGWGVGDGGRIARFEVTGVRTSSVAQTRSSMPAGGRRSRAGGGAR